jgi:hypothetical protein
MTPENFCYWLQGYIELSNCKSLSPEQTQMISNHLQLVFNPICKTKEFKNTLLNWDPTITPSC